MTQVSLSTSTTFNGDLNALVEDQGTQITFRIDLDEPAPAEGTRVYFDSDTVQILNRLDLRIPSVINAPRENINPLSVNTNIDNSGLAFTIDPEATFATVTLTIFDNDEPDTFLPETFDGRVDAEFFVRTASEVSQEDAAAITGISDYTVDPNAASSVVIFVDDASQLPGETTNTPPVADNDSYSTDINTVLTVDAAEGVLDGDTDADGDNLSATIENQPSNGSVNLSNDGSFTYTPDNGFSGNDSFTYIANDGTDDSNPATVSITVNDPSAEKPTVGITLDKSDVVEGETITLTINVDGEIPPEGLEVFINDTVNAQNDITRSLTEFDIANVQLTGIDGFPTPAEGDSGFFVTVTESTATVTLPVLDDGFDEDEANEVFTFEVIDQDAYEVDANASSVTLSITDNEVAANPRSSDFEDGTVQGWTVGQPGNHFAPPENIPSGGPDGAEDNYLRAQSEGGGGVGSRLVWFNQSADWRGNYIEDGATSIKASLINEGSEDVVIRVGFDGPGGRFVTTDTITLTPGSGWQEATFSIEPEDLTAVGGSDVEATLSNVSQIRFLNNATPAYQGAAVAAQVGVDNIAFTSTTTSLPAVSVSTTTPVVSEDESPTINVTFTVDGPIPEGGVPITIAGDFARFFAPGLVDGNVPSVINPEDGFIPIANRDPEFDINLTAPVLTFEATVFDDIIEEEPLTLDVEILGREGTLIGDNVATITVVDGDSVIPGSGPTVSLSVSDTDLSEGDQLTVNFDTEGEIPGGGLEVFVAGGPTALGEFNIFNEDGTPAIQLEGIDEFPIQGGDDGGFFVTLAENQASITLSVFDDGPTEGLETLTFELPNGEQYEVDSNAASVSLSINDGGENAAFGVESGVTSVFLDLPLLEEAAGLTLVGTDTDATPFSENFQVGFAITEDTDFSFAPVPFTPLGGTIEHSGTITLGLNGAEATVGEFSIGYDASRVSETTSGFFVADTLEDALGLEVLFDLSAPGTATVSGEDLEISGGDLLLAPEVANALGLPDLAGADVGDARVDGVVAETTEDLPVLSLTATPETLNEAEGTVITYNFSIDGEIPEGGLTFRSDDLFDAELNWRAFDFDNPSPDELSGLEIVDFERVVDDRGNATFVVIWNMTQPEGFLKLGVLDDNVADAPNSFTVGLVPGEGYKLNPDASEVTVEIIDGVVNTGGPVISMAVSDTEVNEGDPLTVTFTAEGELPEGGQDIFVLSDVQNALGEFITVDENGNPLITTEGISNVEPTFRGFIATMVENTATISFDVFDDGPGEGPETFTYSLQDGETYDIDADSSTFAITVDDSETTSGGWSPGDSYDLVTPPPTYEGELSPGEQANADFVDQLEGQELLEDLQDGGYVIYFRHAQTERDYADQVTADVNDFSTQRVLSEFGIQQSLAIGEGFEISQIPYDEVITSQYGRAVKTAAIAFGEYQKDPALNFLPFEDYTEAQVEEMRANVTPLLTAVPDTGTNTIIVGHDDLFEAGTGIYPDPQGIAYLLKPDGNGEFELIANLLPEEWVELSEGVELPEVTTMPVDSNAGIGEGWNPGNSFDLVTPPPTYEGELSDGEQANADFVDQLEGEELLEELQDGGYVIYFRHAQTEKDFADQVTADVNNFSTQRVLSEFGVKQSLAIGEGFELSEIPIGSVTTSDYGRAVETAAIAFGEYQKDSALNFLPFEDYTDAQVEEMRASVLPLLTAVPETGTNSIIVGHDDLFEAGTGIYPDPQGIAYILEPDGNGDFEIIANLLPEEWVELSQDVVPEVPQVSLTITPDVVSEEGPNNAFTATFTVDGEIPAAELDENGAVISGGLQVLLDVKEIDALGEQFADFTVDGLAFGSYSDPERPTVVSFVLLENTSSITLSMFNDVFEEEPFDFNFELLEDTGNVLGAEYIVTDANSGSFNLIDGNGGPGVGPTVGISVSQTELSEGDEFTVNFNVNGEIPAEGLQVVVQSPTARALGEFAIFDENNNPLVSTQGIAGFPEPYDGQGSSFLVTLTEPSASMTLKLFEDGPNEGEETLTFDLVNGEQYEVDPAASSVSLTINDGAEDAVFTVESGVTSVFLDLPLLETATGIVLVDADSEATPFSDDFQVGFAITPETDFSFAPVPFTPLGGTIEHSGTITLGLGDAQVTLGEFSIGFDPNRVSDTASGFFVADTLDDALGLDVLFDISAPGVVSVAGEDFEISDADLLLAPELAGALGQPDLAGADIGDARVDAAVSFIPEVSLTVNTTTLNEEEGTVLTVNFTVNGVIPEGGLEVALGGEVLPFIDQLDFTNPDNLQVQGLEIGTVREDGAILISLLEPSASLSVKVFDDILPEEDASFNFALLEGEGYSVNQEASGATITVTDGVPNADSPVVGLSVSDTNISEGEEFSVNFSVDGDVSADNPLTVLVESTEVGALGEFNIFNEDNTPAFTTQGIQGDPTVADDTGSSFFVTLTDTEASVTLSVFNDGIGEGTETVNFALVDGESYGLDATNNQVALTIEEGATFTADENGEVTAFAYDVSSFAPGEEVKVSVSEEALAITDADFDNLVGFYEVVDENGGIDTNGDGVADVNPGDAGYAQAALANAVDEMVLRLGGNPDDDTSADKFGDVVIEGGKSYAPFAIANAGDLTVADFLAANPNNDEATSVDDQVAYFAFGEANPDGVNHLKSWGDGIFGFEDLPDNLGISDNDFNDAVFKFNFTA